MFSRVRNGVRIRAVLFCLTALSCLLLSVTAHADDKSGSSPTGIEWHKGPYTADIGGVAQLEVPKGYAYTDAEGTKRFMELTHNPSGGELGMVLPLAKDDAKDGKDGKSSDDDSNGWFVLFSFEETGYVSDSEKDSLDAKKILTSLQKSTEEDNDLRKQKGWAPFHLTGWAIQPFYENTTHNLTWATLGQTDDPKDGETVNYATRFLGRRGAMNVDLVLDQKQMDTVVPAYQELMKGYSFKTGSRYADFVKGDKVAEYGLTALIAGGAAAVAVKTGLFAKLIALLAAMWKAIAVFFAALATRIKTIFKKIKQRFTGGQSDEDRQKQIEAEAQSRRPPEP